jgi:hypothetical protein
MSEFQQFLETLKQPEYVHVLLNPLPVYGLAMGLLALVVALILRNRQAAIVALTIIVVASGSAWLVVRYGHLGYDRVYAMSYRDAQEWLDVHQQRGDQFKYVFYLMGLVALAALVSQWKLPRAATLLTLLTLLTSVLALALGGWIARAGGQVRHSEFRHGPPPAVGQDNDEHPR